MARRVQVFPYFKQENNPQPTLVEMLARERSTAQVVSSTTQRAALHYIGRCSDIIKSSMVILYNKLTSGCLPFLIYAESKVQVD